MPNEEPEGPNLPPKKLTAYTQQKNAEIIDENPDKYIKLKGFIAGITGVVVAISYLAYYYYYYENGVKLNELYFISTGIGISVFTGLLFTFFRNICVKIILMFTSIFYGVLELIYISVWIVQGQPYAYIKQSLIIGLIIGIIYFIYDKFANKPRSVD